MLLEPKNPTKPECRKKFFCMDMPWERLIPFSFCRNRPKKQFLEIGSSKTGSKGCWFLVNERVHRGFSSSLLLTFFMQLQCLFVTVSLCLCLRVLLCMCEYAGGLACSNVGYLKLARQLQGQFISWFGTEFSTFCSVVNINIQDCLFHTGIWGVYGRHHGKRFT